MFKTTGVRLRMPKKLGFRSVIVLAASAACVGLGSAATASADVNEVGVDRTVTSRQADLVSGNSTYGDVRGADHYDVHAQGEVRDSTKAVPDRLKGTRAGGFRGGWPAGPGIGSW
ncbi:hypothetical protein [Mycolicibacterium sp.]|uniref:hypothetical protein n=1 Tax=Mycolicibacterium sp. TaxID=2320850 RepID=UPI003D0B6B58